MKTLNIGILAHVDAGKTSLTERLLLNAGVIKTLGSVDKGNTQTDTMALERQRGITIKAAVTSFNIGDLKVNLIDTPGHPDFIAEVERSLRVLDAVILVISAVEGIQPQTHVLARTLKKLKIPTIIFINKIDRIGARSTELVEDINTRLFSGAFVMNEVINTGTRQATIVPLQPQAQARDIERFEPIFFGSVLTGVGVPELTSVLENYASSSMPDVHAPLSATIFKVERGGRGEKIAYIRMYGGELATRTSVDLQHISSDGKSTSVTSKITTLQSFHDGQVIDIQKVSAGDIVKAWGLREAQIGDYIGQMPAGTQDTAFAPPNLEVVVKPKNNADRSKLYKALEYTREQDPLIHVRQDEQGILSVKLYGEVQREVIKALLHDEYGLDVVFEKTQIIYIEKVSGTGTAFASRHDETNFFVATLGIRIEPSDSPDIQFNPGPGVGSLPTAFLKTVEETIYMTLNQGIYGWHVTNCLVTLTEVGYDSVLSTGGDFRGLTPLLLAEALQKAGTEIYEPINRFELDAPEVALPQLLRSLASSEARINTTLTDRGISHIEGVIPVRQMFDFERTIPDLTSGEGVFVAEFDSYQRTQGKAPARERTDNNPFEEEEYLRRTLSRV